MKCYEYWDCQEKNCCVRKRDIPCWKVADLLQLNCNKKILKKSEHNHCDECEYKKKYGMLENI